MLPSAMLVSSTKEAVSGAAQARVSEAARATPDGGRTRLKHQAAVGAAPHASAPQQRLIISKVLRSGHGCSAG